MSSNMNGQPTCLIIDPARRFGGKPDRLFSDLTARAFWRAGWNVVWVVDHDDLLTDRQYVDVRRILPSMRLVVGAREELPNEDEPLSPQECEVHDVAAESNLKAAKTERSLAGASAPKEKKSPAAQLHDWSRSTWQNLPSARRLAAVPRRAAIRIWYRVQHAMAYARWSRLLYWRIFEWVGGLRRAVIQARHFLGWQAGNRPNLIAAAPAPAGIYGPDLCRLIRQCGPHDVVVMPAADGAQIEGLFDLIPKLQLGGPLPTTLHVRFATVERIQPSSGGIDQTSLGARLKSGSPFRSVFMHCEGSERAAHLTHDLRIPVHALGDESGKAGEACLLRRLSPRLSIGEPCGSDAVPSIVVESFGPVVLLVSALWGRVGSCTIFDAQTRYLIERGCIVVRVLIEHYPRYGDEGIKHTARFLSEMFEQVRPHLHFVANRREDFRHLSELAASAEFRRASPVRRMELLLANAQAEDQDGLRWIAKKAVFAVVNHLPHVEFTSHLTKAPLILETHDIYSKLLATHSIPPFVPPGPDSPELRLIEEKAVWRKVAACVNLSPEDHKIIEKDAAVAALARPYVPRRSSVRRSWPEVLAANGLPDKFRTTNEFDLMLWGSWHDGNVAGIRWFLDIAANDKRLKGLRILIAGRVIRGVPDLRRRDDLYVTEHVDRLEDFMERSRILVIPDQDGTGMSIKAMDALALERCFAATRTGLRGIDLGDTEYRPSADAKDLADDIALLLASQSAREQRASVARRLYDLNFSKPAFRSAWDSVLSRVVPELQLQKRSEPEEDVATYQSIRSHDTVGGDLVLSGVGRTACDRTPRLSVAVCTYNRYDVLPDAIDSLLRQDCEPGLLDIMVIDNSADQAAAATFSKRYSSESRIRYILEPVPGLSNARNVATSHARADLIAFIDDDAIAAPDWATKIVQAFEAAGSRAGVIGGRVLPRWVASRPPWLCDHLLKYLTVIDWGGHFRELPQHQWLAGCNIAFNKQSLTAVGGFSLALGRIGAGLSLLSEDETDVMERMRAAGRVSMYCPDSVVEHVIDPSRLTHSWFRRRAAWQAVSDFIKNPARTSAYAPAAAEHMRLLLKDGRRKGPMGFFGRVEDPNEFKHDVGLIYDLMVATLAGGAELEPVRDLGTVASLKAKAIGTIRFAAQKSRSVRQMLPIAVRAKNCFERVIASRTAGAGSS
jgi:glucosyl-dolichyl phosphate glucuronosyltransferase